MIRIRTHRHDGGGSTRKSKGPTNENNRRNAPGAANVSPLIRRLRAATVQAAHGKVWWYRAPLLLPLGWILFRHVGAADYSSIFGGLNLAIHEAGHLLFMWSRNDFLTVAGGTILQCLCPVFAGIMFYRQKDFFAITIALFWLGTNFTHIAPYAADARAQLLPLVSPFPGAPGHDWNYLLGTLGLLRQDQVVGGAFRAAGILTMGASVAASVWNLRVMAGLAREVGGKLSESDRLA
jgi:hypothetical protein